MDPALLDRYAEEVEVVDQVELSDDESELDGATGNTKYQYEQVPDIEDDSDLEKDEDLATALMSVAMKNSKEKGGGHGDRRKYKALSKNKNNNSKGK